MARFDDEPRLLRNGVGLLVVVGVIWSLGAWWGHFVSGEAPEPMLPAPAASVNSEEAVFGFGEYLSALALLLVALTLSEYRYRFRLSVGAVDLSRVAFVAGVAIGLLLFAVELWAAGGTPLPYIVGIRRPVEAALGGAFLFLVAWLFWVAFFAPPKFNQWNAERYFQVLFARIAAGRESEIAPVAEELRYSARAIVRAAMSAPTTAHREFATLLLVLMADKRFCRAMATTAPGTIGDFFHWFAEYQVAPKLVAHFARNIGTELVLIPTSALHAESDGYSVGLVGYWKPLTTEVYGNYQLVESLADAHGSPLDLTWPDRADMTTAQFDALLRGATTFVSAYLSDGREHTHSRAFSQLLAIGNENVRPLYKLSGNPSVAWTSPEYQRARSYVQFLADTVALLDERGLHPKQPLRPRRDYEEGILNEVARSFVEAVKAASTVAGPTDTAWQIHYGTVWSPMFGHTGGTNWTAVRFKIRRLLYDEIAEIERWPNYVNVRLLGFCLNVLGVREGRSPRAAGRRESEPLKLAVIAIAKRRFRSIRDEYPDLADAMQIGGISYDEVRGDLVKTYAKTFTKEAAQDRLKVG